MQTFLPLPDMYASAMTLDKKRLGNQCWKETKILLYGGWKHHPASKMWRGHEFALAEYGFACAIAMMERGWYRPFVRAKWARFYEQKMKEYTDTGLPWWIGQPDIHASHRANLLRKNPEWYGQFGWNEVPKEGYVWPI